MRQRILVVEDEPAYREALKFLLEKEGFTVETASNGLAALAAFEARPPDLVLLDLMLPRLSGPEVFRRLRKVSQVPVIMVTAKDAPEQRATGLELGADDYVTKPFSGRELVARIRSVLRRSAAPEPVADAAASRVEESRGIRLDPERLTMTMGGAVSSLPPKEFALLLELMRARGRVLTREVLIDRVWGADFMGDTKTLDVHVKRLRGRIEEAPGRPTKIVTLRGVGYTFEPDEPRA